MFQSVNTNCQESICTPECLDYWRTLRQHPCFQGDVYELLKYTVKQKWGQLGRNQYVSAFINRLDSCYTQLVEEEDEEKPNSGPIGEETRTTSPIGEGTRTAGPIGEGTRIGGPYLACVLVLVLNMLF